MGGIDVRAADSGGLPKEEFPTVGHEFRIHVAQEAFDLVTTRGASDTSREIGGVLVGRPCRDDGGTYLRVEAAIYALHAEEKGTELTFTHATWDQVHREMEAKHAGAKIVGWFHTHPGFGVFLSDRDQFIQRSFFNLPFQVALVFDPISREHGVFAWRDNEPVRVRRWWVGDREHIWDGAHPPRAPAPPGKSEEERPMSTATRAEGHAPAVVDVSTLVLTGVVFLIFGAFGGWWFGTRAGEAATAISQQALAEERVRGMREAVRELNVELLATLRRSVDTNARNAELDAAIADLDAARGALDPAADATKEPAARLAAARNRVKDLRDAPLRVNALLTQLEQGLRAGSLDPQQVVRAIGEHGQMLAQICVTLAESTAKQGDADQARLLFTLAVRADPANAEAYKKRAESALGGGPK